MLITGAIGRNRFTTLEFCNTPRASQKKRGPGRGRESMSFQQYPKTVLKRFALILAVVLFSLASAPASDAQTRLVVRDSLGLPGINLTCRLLGCQVCKTSAILTASSSL